MKEKYQEIEVKIPLSDLSASLKKAESMNLECIQPASHEINYRYDTPERTLSATGQVLRLRKTGDIATITYKRKQEGNSSGIAVREEIETNVTDFDAARLLLERLGFSVFFIYEKERSIYQLDDTVLMFDHTPIGDFLEIEGPDETAIQKSALIMELPWSERTAESYSSLFKKWLKHTDRQQRDMIFQK